MIDYFLRYNQSFSPIFTSSDADGVVVVASFAKIKIIFHGVVVMLYNQYEYIFICKMILIFILNFGTFKKQKKELVEHYDERKNNAGRSSGTQAVRYS
jgi:hypothetical protein